jgi:hypothetical protein
MRKTLTVATLFISMMCAPGTLPQSAQPCSKGGAQRVLHRDEPAHILVAVEAAGKEDEAIAAIWRRILLRIPDVRLVDTPANTDLAIFVNVREIHNQDSSIDVYVWHAKVVQPWTVVCGTGQTYYLEQPKGVFMNYAATLETASEMIQKSVNTIEDREFQTIRNEKRR